MSTALRVLRPRRLSPSAWAAWLNDRAVDNARTGATECSRRRVEREEVAQYLVTRAVASRSTRRPA